MIAFFTPTNNHVIYYHKGKRTIRVFRTQDGRQIADMRCPAKVRQAIATIDGRALVVAYEDGAVQMFLIVDPYESTSIEFAKQWRQEQLEASGNLAEQEVPDKKNELHME